MQNYIKKYEYICTAATETNCGNIVKPHWIIMEKICANCKENKNIEDFTYNSKPNLCTPCAKQYYKDEYVKRRDIHLSNRAKYYAKNKETILEKLKSDENKQKRNARNKERRQTDPSFRISESLKIRIIEVLREHKMDSTSKHIGCTKEELMNWLESQFDENMSWDNYASYWQVDHMIRIKFFDITDREQQLICFNWTNLRPLEKRKNISKFSKILEDDILLHCQILVEFVENNPEYQEYFEKSIWSRFQLEYGNNYEDEDSFKNFLKSIIRIEASNAE